MLILNSRNRSMMRDFEASRYRRFCGVRFFPRGREPDGTPVNWHSRWRSPGMRRRRAVRFAVCQHHFPENFWDPAFQTHANGVTAVPGVALVADNPTDHHIFLKALPASATCIPVRSASPRAPRTAMSRSWSRCRFAISSASRRGARRGDDTQSVALRSRRSRAGRNLAPAEQHRVAAPYRTAGGAAGRRLWRNPDIRDC